MDKLTGMAVFARVVEERSFTKAADGLGLSKSAVSKQIRKLEDRLGARLLNRTTRSLALTDVGQAFYERCARIVAEADEAALAVTQMQTLPRGLLRVTVGMSFGHLHAADAVADFLRLYPDLDVELSLNDRMVDLIDEGFDLALRIGRLQDSSLIARRLATVRTVTAAAPSYLRERGTPRHPRELVDHRCFVYTLRSEPARWTGPGGETFEYTLRGAVRANNGDALLRMAEAGLGVAYLPDFLCGPALREGKLVELFPEWSSPETSLFAVYPHNRHLSAKVRLFVDFLAERWAQPTWGAPSLRVLRSAP